jgi:uncharacterized iron-regulated membrane protein
MAKSIRQSMAWLHSWIGLCVGWLLFCIFLFGSLSYYRQEISAWMQPEYSQVEVNQIQALTTGLDYLQQHATDANRWFLDIAKPNHPINRMYWQKADQSYGFASIDPITGKEIVPLATQGGDFFYQFHFQLYAMPIVWGRTICAALAFLLLIILISGVITHKKIFKDFFTLRLYKSQRSWLDFHNVSAVIALPFYLVMAFTGLMLVFYFFIPQGLNQAYGDHRTDYFEQIREKQASKNATFTAEKESLPLELDSISNPKLNIPQIVGAVQKQWQGKLGLDTMTVNFKTQNLADQTALMSITTTQDKTITLDATALHLSQDGKHQLTDPKNHSAVGQLYYGIYGLHLARFAEPLTRASLFFAGILGTLMIASGLLLWSLKRELQNKKQLFHLGHELVYRLNLTVLIGVPIAVMLYLYSNRIATLSHWSVQNIEIPTFFLSILCCGILNCLLKKHYLWCWNLGLFAGLALCLPIINIVQLWRFEYLKTFTDYAAFMAVDITLFLFGLLALYSMRYIAVLQVKSSRYLVKKLNKKATMDDC